MDIVPSNLDPDDQPHARRKEPVFTPQEQKRLDELTQRLAETSRRTATSIYQSSAAKDEIHAIEQALKLIHDEALRFHYNYLQLHWSPYTLVISTVVFVFIGIFGHHEFSVLVELVRIILLGAILLLMSTSRLRRSKSIVVHYLCMILIMFDLMIIGSEVADAVWHRRGGDRLYWFHYVLMLICAFQLSRTVLMIYSIDGISYAIGSMSLVINTAIKRGLIVSPFRSNAGFVQRRQLQLEQAHGKKNA